MRHLQHFHSNQLKPVLCRLWNKTRTWSRSDVTLSNLEPTKKRKKKLLKLKECSAVVTLWFGCHYHMSFCWLMKWRLTVWPADNTISVLSKKCQYFFDFLFFFSRPSSRSGAELCFASQAETSAGSDKEIVHIRRSRWEEGEEKQHVMLALWGG